MTLRIVPAGSALVVAVLVCAVGNATTQGDAGTVASVLGTVQVRRVGAETWEQIQSGTSFDTEASLRTGPRSAARIVLYDGSVVEMAAATEISAVHVAQVPTGKRYLSLVRLLEGKLHVLVGEQYGLEGSRFEVETPAAVTSARGGEFLVLHDGQAELTTVVGLEREVAVESTIGLIGPGVTVGPKTLTQTRRGRFPAPPGKVDAQALLGYREGLAVLGTGHPGEGIGSGHPALTGRILRPEDLPEQTAKATQEAPSVSGLTFPDRGLPGESLAESLSPDVRVHSQPIPEYRSARPGDRPVGGVQVDF